MFYFKCFPKKDYPHFASGCLDNVFRIWNYQTGQKIYEIPVPNKISCIKSSPNNSHLVIGMYNGKCVHYHYNLKEMKFRSIIKCRNAWGTFSKGRKVSGISFMDTSRAIITTCDNRIRIIDLNVNLIRKKNRYLNIKGI